MIKKQITELSFRKIEDHNQNKLKLVPLITFVYSWALEFSLRRPFLAAHAFKCSYGVSELPISWNRCPQSPIKHTCLLYPYDQLTLERNSTELAMSSSIILRSCLYQSRFIVARMTIGRQGLFRYSSNASSDNGNYERKVYEERNRRNEMIEEKRSRLLYQSRKRGKTSLWCCLKNP